MKVAISRRHLLGTTIGLALEATSGTSFAENYPSHIVKLIVPFPAGSATDGVARKLAEGFTLGFQKTFMVENRPGADGIIAARAAAHSDPDGYTIFITTNTTHSANPSIYVSLPYDPETDFAPIGGIMKIPMLLAVRADFPASDLASFIQIAKKRQMTFGSGNTSSRGAAELFKAQIGAEMVHVPYRGTPQAITDLLGGNIDFMFPDPSSAAGPIKGNQLRLLGVTGSKRLAQFPDVPTFAELGYPGVEMVAWVGAFVPANTSPEIVSRLNATLNKIIDSEGLASYFSTIGAQAWATTPQELRAYEAEDRARWATIVDIGHIEKTSGSSN
jgi:tripartite-type tricarboxylate transporter receptor subunit TctC